MQSLFQAEQTQVEILDFQTFSNDYVATRYGITTSTINDHKRLHADEILENVHFVTEQNKLNRPIIKWTLRGIIKLGMFIRSPQAKNFRLWAEQELEKSINAELENARLARERNLELTDKIANLEAVQISQAKHHENVVNDYKSQISRKNALIKSLKNDKSSPILLQMQYNEAIFDNEKLKKELYEKHERVKMLAYDVVCLRDELKELKDKSKHDLDACKAGAYDAFIRAIELLGGKNTDAKIIEN